MVCVQSAVPGIMMVRPSQSVGRRSLVEEGKDDTLIQGLLFSASLVRD